MRGEWRHLVAALRFVTRGTASPRGALKLVPLAGIFVGAAGAMVYWLAALAWPASIAVMLSILATLALSAPDRPEGGALMYRIVFLLLKYNALMALSSAHGPFPLPDNVTLGLIMVAGQAASQALAVSVMATDVRAEDRMSTFDLSIALAVGAAPGAVLGIPGLIGLAAALAVRLGIGLIPLRAGDTRLTNRLEVTQQSSELSFFLAALATWKYV